MGTLYCSLLDVHSAAGPDYVNLRLDDDPEAVGDILDEACRDIDFYCVERYRDNLVRSAHVRRWAALRAAILLGDRRGNGAPAALQKRWDDLVTQKLGPVQQGGANIPDIPEKKAAVPVLSNVSVQNWPTPRVVVQGPRSTGTPAGYDQRRDQLDILDYNI
jgi:hypothetical protein